MRGGGGGACLAISQHHLPVASPLKAKREREREEGQRATLETGYIARIRKNEPGRQYDNAPWEDKTKQKVRE